MLTPLHTEIAVLVELLRGPGYGLEIIERVTARGRGRIRLRQGGVYPTLRRLVRRGLLRSWTVTTPGSGRPRTYYELTSEGLVAAGSHREALERFASNPAPAPPSRAQLDEMRARLVECCEVSEAALWLKNAGRRRRR